MAVISSGAFAQTVTKTSATVTVTGCNGAPTAAVDVYRPSGSGPFPLVAIGHGFQNSKDNEEGLARALGALGIAVVVPQFPSLISGCGSDHARNARVMIAALDQQVSVGGIDSTKLGFAGHSAGGLSAFLAAAQRPVAAVVLLDAVDSNSLGVTAAAMVTAPTIFLFAEPSSCNQQGNATGWFTAMGTPKARLKVVNANHCDPQEPISGLCTIGCGGAAMTSTVRSAIYKRYAVDFFKRYLLGLTMPCLEATAQADAVSGLVSSVDFLLGGCGSVVDAGQPIDAGVADAGAQPIDAGAPDSGADAGAPDAGQGSDAGSEVPDAGQAMRDAGTTQDAGTTPDAGTISDAGDPGTPVSPSGCSCATADVWGLVALTSLMLARRRR